MPTGAESKALPPPDRPAHEVFSILLQCPRPIIRVEYEIQGLETATLEARALTRNEIIETALDPAAFVQKALLVDGAPAFRNATEAAETLDEITAEELKGALRKALSIVPYYGASDPKAWGDYLLEGAEHIRNAPIAWSLGGCVDRFFEMVPEGKALVYRSHAIERPDRFFGIPLGQLLDCHMMIYRIARRFREEHSK